MGNLYDHAERELRLAGLLDKGSDYDGELGAGVLEVVKVFEGQKHSGFSAATANSLLGKLLSFEPLTPLTDNPDDWVEVGPSLWQNKRDSKAFSTDRGKTYKHNTDSPAVVRTSEKYTP